MKKFTKLYAWALRAIPVCAAVMMAFSVNSTATWAKGQEEVPASAKRYRRF